MLRARGWRQRIGGRASRTEAPHAVGGCTCVSAASAAGYRPIVVIATKCLELSLPALPSSVRVARAAVTEAVAPFASEELADDVRLCVSEAVTNAIRHAYGPEVANGEVEVLVVRLEDELRIVVRDEGRGLDEPPVGEGFGLQIIARVAARHTLHGGENGTTVSMSFDLGRAGTD